MNRIYHRLIASILAITILSAFVPSTNFFGNHIVSWAEEVSEPIFFNPEVDDPALYNTPEITEEEINALLETIQSYNSMNDTQRQMICAFYNVEEDSMLACAGAGYDISNSIKIISIEKTLGATLEEVQEMIANYGSVDTAAAENNEFQDYRTKSYILRADESTACKDLLIEGIRANNIINAYIISYMTGGSVFEICARSYEETQNADLSDYPTELQQGLKGLAVNYSVKLEYIAEYLLQTGTSLEAFEEQILDKKAELNLIQIYENKYPDTVSLAATEPDEIIEDTSIYLGAPYDYSCNVNESINLYNGSLNYAANLLTLPGKNGLDLNLNLQYNSAKSNQYDISCTGTRMSNGGIRYKNVATKREYKSMINEPALGWSFGFTKIYNNYITFEDGSTYKIENGKLKGYEMSDRSISISNAYGGKTVNYIDGRKEEFDNKDRLRKIADRYNNSITFSYSVDGKTVTITDTMGRKVKLTSNQDTYFNGKVTITLPDNNTIKLTMADSELDCITDQEGRETFFNYTRDEVSFDLSPSGYSVASEENAFYNLNNVAYPNNTYADYTYDCTGVYDYKMPQKSFNYSNIRLYNEDGDLKNTSVSFYSNRRTGGSKPSQLQTQKLNSLGGGNTDENRCTWITDSTGKMTSYYFHNGPPYRYVQEEKDGKLLAEKKYIYVGGILPKTISSKIFDPNNQTKYIENEVNYQYLMRSIDGQSRPNGMIQFYWDEQAEGSTRENEHRTFYSYNASYYVPIEMQYKQDADTSIRYTYIPTSDRKAIAEENIWVKVTGENYELKQKTSFTYDNSGMLTGKTQENGTDTVTTNIAYAYNDDASYTQTNTTGDRTEIYTYDNMGRLQTYQDGNGNITAYAEYDKLGRQKKVVNPDATYKTWTYDDGQNLLVETDENGNSIEYGYNGLGKIKSVRDITANQYLKQFSYDAEGRLTCYTDGNGNTENYGYETFGRIARKEIKNAGGTTEQKITLEYTDYVDGSTSKMVQTIDGDGGSPAIKSVEYTNKYGFVSKSGRIEGSTEYLDTFQYDYLGNRIQELSAMDAGKGKTYTNQYTYDHAGRVLTAKDCQNNTYINVYDMLGQKVRTIDAKGGTVDYTYDPFGQVLTTSGYVGSNLSIKGYVYDLAGNMVKEYTTNNINEESSKHETLYSYDSRNRLSYTQNKNDDGSAVYTELYYDNAGNQTDMYIGSTAPGAKDGNHTAYTYDHRNRVTGITDPMGYTEQYTSYDGNDNLKSKTDKKGKTFRYEYTALNQPKTVMVPETGEYVYYGYYATGLPATMSYKDHTGKLSMDSYTYDGFGRLRSESREGVSKEYEYNLSDARTSLKITQGYGNVLMEQSYTYNELNQLSKVYKGTESEGNLIASYSYDANGNTTEVLNGNGTRRLYEYGSTSSPNLLTKMINEKTNGEQLSSYTYGYYTDGNISEVSEERGVESRSISYMYDRQGRLKSESDSLNGGRSYTYDNYGNRKSMVGNGVTIIYDYNKNNQLLKETREEEGKTEVVEYTYDRNGNLTGKMGGAYAAVSGEEEYSIGELGKASSVDVKKYEAGVYEYDSFNRLTKAVNGGSISTYTYNGSGQRQSKTVNGITTNHIWDGSNIAAETDGSQAVTARYYRGAALIAQEKQGSTEYFQMNGRGDVTGLTDSSGENVKTFTYDAFGNQLGEEETSATPFRYNGEYYDEETDLIYLRNRYYSPSVGQFITEDPVKDGTNWYAYCGNNSVMFVDPLGLEYIVVSGSEYDAGRYKYNFIEPAIKKIKELKELNDGEWITWIVSATDYSEESLQQMNDIAYELGVGFVKIYSAAELQNYINSQNINTWELSEERVADPIRKFTVFSHGVAGKVELGYGQTNQRQLSLDYNWTRGISSYAFDNPNSMFYSCNTGTDQTVWGTNFAQAWVNVVGGRTMAARGTTWYGDIMNGSNVSIRLRRGWRGFDKNGSDNYPVASAGVEWMNFYRW